MYGWRSRIGIVVPCVNITMEPEFNRLAQRAHGISIHCARMHLSSTADDGLSYEALLQMEPQAIDMTVPELAHAEVNVIVYGCTSGSFVGGLGWDKNIIEKIKMKTGIPATTTSTAVVSALESRKIKRLALGAPYSKEVTQLGKTFLEESGFEVVNMLALDNVYELRDAPIHLAYKLGKLADSPKADCVFISCTQFPTIEVISDLEADLGKPVISANQASFWHALKITKVKFHLSGYGSLLENP